MIGTHEPVKVGKPMAPEPTQHQLSVAEFHLSMEDDEDMKAVAAWLRDRFIHTPSGRRL